MKDITPKQKEIIQALSYEKQNPGLPWYKDYLKNDIMKKPSLAKIYDKTYTSIVFENSLDGGSTISGNDCTDL